ncbi:uncharacterized protein LOC133802197 [Humulus lupulus]|uniref:uncharacterized protein LOC133802033 n=1 Tax=Humulus lupulus TaxID=3486 RepID=UPI002B40900E|nr:uncharacterized protein LOC133802033 [Humulus lupulus]XP_062096458.1 uncharacterized protein LOC133802197 [Humulus lupulus]
MDAIVSSFNAFETKEADPLILTWAVFLCLISSLPGKEENNVLMEIDHISYVRQAFEAASLRFFHEILESDLLNESDGPVAGYRSVLRTFISAFIASYEINIQVIRLSILNDLKLFILFILIFSILSMLQLEDSTLNLILDILCKVYLGEVWLHNDCLSGSFIDYLVDFSLVVLLKLTFFFSFVVFLLDLLL